MTIEQFYETLRFISELDERLNLQKHLVSVRDALNNLVASPAVPQHQSALADAKAAFTNAVSDLNGSVSPTQLSAIAVVGGGKFFDPSIGKDVNDAIITNAMTPSVARDFVRDLASRREQFLATVHATLAGLRNLGVQGDSLPPGSADMAFLIPRDLFDNEVGSFATELAFFDRLLKDYSEALTGTAEPPKLEGLSSSTPTVFVLSGLKVIGALAEVVTKFLNAWKSAKELRDIKEKLTKLGVDEKAIGAVTERITTTVDEVVEETVQITLSGYSGSTGRKNELENAVRQDTQRLFTRIERGLAIQFRAESKKDADEKTRATLDAINQAGHVIQFPQPNNEPILLSDGEILEGDPSKTVTFSKTTKKSSTTTTKKESHKGGKHDGTANS